MLGICYGQQVMAQALGGEVGHTEKGEYGKTSVSVEADSFVLAGVPEQTQAWMSHRDAVVKPPPGFKVIASTEICPVAAMEDPDDALFGVQFHPEVAHTPRGMDVMRNFLYKACEIAPTWTPVSIIDESIEAIRAQVGDSKVVCALSGGVDSAVAALLVHRAIGDQLTCIFVDHGLLRENEAEQVVEAFKRHFHVELIHVDAREKFLGALAGVTDPERKRKIIGELFIRTFEEISRGIGDVKFLVQGTLYPDVIESGGADGVASTIKSHHNVGGLPEDMDFELVEPLRKLFKDEVRKIGEELGLPPEMVQRQPFPGPGLAVRIIGEITAERIAIVQRADAIVREELKRAGLEREIWQSYAALLGVQSVGVQGDERTYAHPIVVRAVTSEDAMTADWARIPHDVLEKISIAHHVRGARREPRCLRHHVEAARHDRVGIAGLPEGLELQTDVSPADWIVQRLWPWNADVGTRVGSVIPDGFETYARIFHAYEGQRWADLARTSGRTMHAGAQFALICGDVDRRSGRDGSLGGVEAAALARVLAPFGSSEIWGCIWEGFGFLTGEISHNRDARRTLDNAPKVRTRARSYLLFKTIIEHVPDTKFGVWFQSFNLWWPDDRAWCVAKEIDLDSTLVGGSRRCIEAVLASSQLEALEISLDMRLDWQGDTIN